MDVKDCERKGWEERGWVALLSTAAGGVVGMALVGVGWWVLVWVELSSR